MLRKKLTALMRDGKFRTILELVADLIEMDGLTNPFEEPALKCRDRRKTWAADCARWELLAGGFAPRHVWAELRTMPGVVSEWREVEAVKNHVPMHLRVQAFGVQL